MHRNRASMLKTKLRRLAEAGRARWHRYCYEKEPPPLRTRPHFLLRRKVLLALAIVILVLGAVFHPLSFVGLLWARTLFLVIVAAFVVAAGVQQVAATCLGTKGRLWYTRPIAPLFLLLVLALMHALLPMGDCLVARAFGVGPFLSSSVAGHSLLALELMWIALLR